MRGLTASIFASALVALPRHSAASQRALGDHRVSVEGGFARREAGAYDPWAKKSGQSAAVAIEIPQSAEWSLRFAVGREMFANAFGPPVPLLDRSPSERMLNRIGGGSASADWNPGVSGYNWLHAYSLSASVRRYFGSPHAGFFVEPLVGFTLLSAAGQRSPPGDVDPGQHSYRMGPGLAAGYLLQAFPRVALSLGTAIRSTAWDVDGNGGGSPTWLSEPLTAGLAFRW